MEMPHTPDSGITPCVSNVSKIEPRLKCRQIIFLAFA